MKNIILSLCLAGCTLLSIAQNKPAVIPFTVPIDSISKHITYEGVVQVTNIPAEELYLRFKAWFHAYYKNPTEVIRENDSTKMSIVGKPRFRISYLQPNQEEDPTGGIVQYTITVTAKEGRFRYELTDFTWKQPSLYPCERWLDTNSRAYSPNFNNYLEQLDKNALETVSSLKKAVMTGKPKKDKDNW